MVHRLLPVVVALAAATAVWNLDPNGSQQAFGQEVCRTAGDLFYNYHGRTYLRRNPGSGWTRTVVSWDNTLFDFGSWGRSPIAVAPQSLLHKWKSH